MDKDQFNDKEFVEELLSALTEVNERLVKKEKEHFKYAHGAEPGSEALAQFIDHTILAPEATTEAVLKVCDEAVHYHFKTVCVRPHHVKESRLHLKGKDVAVCSVVCFPEGTQSTDEKISQAKAALQDGASELDFVINYGQLLAKQYTAVYSELVAIARSVQIADNEYPTIKIILETSQLTNPDIVAACLLASKAGFNFVKTSTGFLGHGARLEHVRLMREVCEMEGGRMKVKASGGIRTAEITAAMLDAGAERLGLSGSVAIMEEGRGSRDAVRSSTAGAGY